MAKITEKDFEIMKRMFDNAIRFKIINTISTVVGDMNSTQTEKNISEIKVKMYFL